VGQPIGGHVQAGQHGGAVDKREAPHDLVAIDDPRLDAPGTGETVAPVDVGATVRGCRHLDAADRAETVGTIVGQLAVAADGVLRELAEGARRACLEHKARRMRAGPAGARQSPSVDQRDADRRVARQLFGDCIPHDPTSDYDDQFLAAH
jgi:hypothetical protein